MRHAYIKFQTQEDRNLGLDELVTHSHISRLSNDIFCIPCESLAMLEARELHYTFATEEELSTAHPIWNFASTDNH